MSGVLGIWHRDGRPVAREILIAASARLRHRGGDGDDVWVAGEVGLASQLSRVTPESAGETQPVVGRAGSVLVFDGRLDNRSELGSGGEPDSHLVLASHDALGERCVERLNGDFAFAVFDPARRQLLLARDAIGVRPLYYAVAGSTIAFASEIKAILATGIVAAKPNDALLAEYLLRRSQLNADRGETFFDRILAVPPGCYLVATPDRVEIARYWSLDLGRHLPHHTFPEYAEAFRDLFAQAVRRRLRSAHPVAVAVSGGLDSTAIMCFAVQAAMEAVAPGGVKGFSSMGRPGSPADESTYVEAIERHSGVTIDRFSGAPLRMTDGVRDMVGQVEAPMVDLQWAHSRALQQHMRGSGARVVLTGHWGDQVLFDQTYLVDLIAQLRWGLAWQHLREFPRWYTDVNPRDFYRTAAVDLVKRFIPGGSRVVSSVRKALGAGGDPPWYGARLHGASTPNGDVAWRDRRFAAHSRAIAREATNKFHTLYLEWNNKIAASSGLEIAFPFLDRDLVSFLVAVPGEVASHDGVPRALLRAAGRGIMPPETTARRWKADFTTLVNAGVRDDLENVRQVIGRESLAIHRGYVERAATDSYFAGASRALAQDTADFVWAVRDIVGLEVWLQTFCGDTTLVGG